MIYELVITILLALSLAYVLRLIYQELRPNYFKFDKRILDDIDWSGAEDNRWEVDWEAFDNFEE